MNRLTLLQINIIGIVVALIVALVMFLGLIKPKQDLKTSKEAEITSVEADGSGGTDQQVTSHKNLLAKTKKDAARTDADWKVNSARYMPEGPFKTGAKPDDVIGLYEGSKEGIKDLPTKWGEWVTAWYKVQEKYGVTRLPGIEFPIPAIGPDPNAITRLTHLTFPADGRPWQVAVQCKSFNAAMAHLSQFNDMEQHGMPVINNVALSGQSPNLLMTYDLSLYVIPNTPPPAEDPRLGGGAGGGAGGGFGGGMPGMMPGGGMPGMMPGGMGRGGMMPGGMGPGGPGGMSGIKGGGGK